MVFPKAGSGMGIGVMAFLLALAFIVGPLIIPGIYGPSQWLLVAFGVLLLILGTVIIVITRLYQKTYANEALVRTGMGGMRTIIDGGSLVIPLVHRIIPVYLETMRLDVERSGPDALITGDNLRADVAAEFYIKVQKKKDDVVAAATSLGERFRDVESIKKLVFQKLVSALRTVAATRDLNELHAKRDDFAAAVQQIVEKDLAPNGLTLESVTISRLDQTPPDTMRGESNVFDAQGLRTIAEITQSQRIARNKIEREADQKVKAQDVERDRFVYEQEVSRSEADANKDRDIKQAQAKAKQEAETLAAEQEGLAGVALVHKEEGILLAEVDKDRSIEVANQQREQAAQEAEIIKQRAIEIADRERQIAVANKEKERAQADADRFTAETSREGERQEVLTVEVTKTAEREKDQAVIAEKAEIEKQKLREQMEADVKAYAQVKIAEGDQQAAEKKAAARLTLAEAEKNAKSFEASGEQAVAMVPVNVERERVSVEEDRVLVRRKDLEAQAQFETIARELQVELARIAAEKDARIAMAKSLGEALGKAEMTVWGDPTTLQSMTEAFYTGQAQGRYLKGLSASIPGEMKEVATNAIHGLGDLGVSVIERLTGVKVKPEDVESAIHEMGGSQQ
jgi:uncharacterized membrane protein YqiK